MFPQDMNLNYKVPTVSHDGQVTVLNNAIDGMAVINFVQFRPPQDGVAQGDVVASVSFPNLVAFEKYVKDMQDNLKQHKERQKNRD